MSTIQKVIEESLKEIHNDFAIYCIKNSIPSLHRVSLDDIIQSHLSTLISHNKAEIKRIEDILR